MGGSRPAAQPQGERAERGGGVTAPDSAWHVHRFYFSSPRFFFVIFPLLFSPGPARSRARCLTGKPLHRQPPPCSERGAHLQRGGEGRSAGSLASGWAGPTTPCGASEAAQSALGRAAVGAGSNRISVEREKNARQTLNLAGVTQELVSAGLPCLQVLLEQPPQPHTFRLTRSSLASTARTCATGISSSSALRSQRRAPIGWTAPTGATGNAERPRFSQ